MKNELLKLADGLERLAFSMPAPNQWTPQFVEFAIAIRSLADGRGEGVDTRLHNLLSAFDKIAGIAQRHAGTVDAIEERGGEQADDPMDAIHYIAQNAYGDWRELYGRQKVTLTSTEPPTAADDETPEPTEAQIEYARGFGDGVRHGEQLRATTDAGREDAPKHGDDAGDGLRYVLCQVGFGDHYKDWLLIPHADGQYVTAAKLVPFSMAILRAAMASDAGKQL